MNEMSPVTSIKRQSFQCFDVRKKAPCARGRLTMRDPRVMGGGQTPTSLYSLSLNDVKPQLRHALMIIILATLEQDVGVFVNDRGVQI
jgi:hypothetical protein